MKQTLAGLSPRGQTGKSDEFTKYEWWRIVDINDDLPQNMPKKKRDLDPMSVEELREYISEMEEEIERVNGEITKKQSHRANVDSLFRK